MSKKVKSIEEYKKDLLPEAQRHAKTFNAELQERIREAKESKSEDFSDLVLNKIENDGVSYSALKRFRVSPLSYIDYLTEPFEKTAAMILGDIVDVITTREKDFSKEFFIMPEGVSRRSNEGKAMYELYLDMAAGKTAISIEDFEIGCNMVGALYRNEDARFYIDRMFKAQKWIRFTHKETGLKCRGIIDWESEEENPEYPFFICDLKTGTTADPAPNQFPRQVINLWYNGQAGFYTLGYKYKWKFPDFIHVVVESKTPYNVNVFRMDRNDITAAQEEVHNTLMAFKYCLDNNLWHKSYDFIRDQVLHYDTLIIPKYYKPKF